MSLDDLPEEGSRDDQREWIRYAIAEAGGMRAFFHMRCPPPPAPPRAPERKRMSWYSRKIVDDSYDVEPVNDSGIRPDDVSDQEYWNDYLNG